MSIESNVKEWVKYDNIIKEYESKVKLLKEKRNTFEENIYQYALQNNKPNLSIKINDGNLNLLNKYSTNINIQILESCLLEKFNKKDVENIITL